MAAQSNSASLCRTNGKKYSIYIVLIFNGGSVSGGKPGAPPSLQSPAGDMHVLLLLLLGLSATTSIEFGANVHDGGADPQKLATRLAERNLLRARFDLWGNDPKSLAKFRSAVSALNDQGIKSEAVVFTIFSRGQRRSEDCDADLAEVESTAYHQTLPQINATKDLLHDYELQNEITLYPNVRAENTTGQNSSDFDVPCGRMQAAVLRGMSRAIVDVRNQASLPLRITLGTTDRQFGFLRFAKQQRVEFDVVGYHIYPWEQNKPLDEDPWFGPGGPLGQLGLFRKPVRINEYNAGEIYSGTGAYSSDPSYENVAGRPVTEKGFRSMHGHLLEIVSNNVAEIEAVLFYESVDEPSKNSPENRFGLFYDSLMESPKISLILASCFAGGSLSPDERDSLVQRKLGNCTGWNQSSDTTTGN